MSWLSNFFKTPEPKEPYYGRDGNLEFIVHTPSGKSIDAVMRVAEPGEGYKQACVNGSPDKAIRSYVNWGLVGLGYSDDKLVNANENVNSVDRAQEVALAHEYIKDNYLEQLGEE